LAGNSILSAAMIAYGGAFTSDYRLSMHEEWVEKIKNLNIEL